MARLLLIDWDAESAKKRVAQLKRSGHDVSVVSEASPATLRNMRDNPPDVFVIDLSRLPSHGRAVGAAMRQQKSTRRVPLVFVDGDPEKVAPVRELLPDAIYAEWRGIAKTIREALAARIAEPVVPAGIPGYANAPLPKKLGIRAGSSILLVNAPSGFERKLKPLPERVRLLKDPGTSARLVLLFVKSRSELNRDFMLAARSMEEKGGVWIIWPKKGSSAFADLTQADVRQYGLAAGFVDYKICAVDETWSGLLFTRRK